jgi:hypothetical protein
MLNVFGHSGFPVTSSVEYGACTLRFSIDPTATYRAALAYRELSRNPPGRGPASSCDTRQT